MGHFGLFLGHFGHSGSFWSFLVIFDLNWPKTRVRPYFLPTGPDFQNSNTGRCGISMCIFASFCENCERNFFWSTLIFSFLALYREFFRWDFQFRGPRVLFKGRTIFLSNFIIIIPGKFQLRTVQLKKVPLIISSRKTCQKFRKIGSLGESYGRGGRRESPREGGGRGEKNAFPIS